MSAQNIDILFHPKTIAVIGASTTPGSVGYALFRNLITCGFGGTVYPVNPNHDNVQGVQSFRSVSEIDNMIDLAVIAIPAGFVPEAVLECGRKGVKAVVVISAGFRESGDDGKALTARIKQTVQEYGMTLLGPNCLGFIHPPTSLNVSFARKMAKKGKIAFISQSGALMTAILDWSVKESVGFSYFVSAGEMADIGFHDLIDYIGNDSDTSSILIYMESLSNADEFLRAAKNYTRTKPIIVLKVGKSPEGAKAALSHTGSVTGSNEVFDQAFKRSGILRVNTIRELFDCAKTLSMQERPHGKRLTIITNAGGPGVIACDALIDYKGVLAKLTDGTIEALNGVLPSHWSHANPVDILGDADSGRYRRAIDLCLSNTESDGLIVILTPQSMTDAEAVAREVVAAAKGTKKTVLAAWMGEDDVAVGRRILEEGSIPVYERPESAVRAFMNMYRYEDNLRHLAESEGSDSEGIDPDTVSGKGIIAEVRRKNRTVLTEPEAKKLLSYYGIPIARGEVVHSEEEAIIRANEIGYPVAVKIVSPDILHKSDIGGVRVGVDSEDGVRTAYKQMILSAKQNMPQAVIDGVYVEAMARKKFELLIGSKKDQIFGPVVVFGSGGTLVELLKDTSIGLPPLTAASARRLMEETKIYTVLSGYRGEKGVDISTLIRILCNFSRLIMDFPEISEMDINPLTADSSGFMVLDAKVILENP